MLSIRPYQPQDQDQDAIFNLILSIQQTEFDIPITREQQPDLADIPGFYQQGSGNFWVAVADQQIVGSIALVDIGNQQAALRKMFVAPAYRGATFGTARLLLEELLVWAASQHLREIYLGTTDKFLAAHRFYEKHRFVMVAPDDLPARFPRMAVDSRFYCYTLG
jgi:N-acetylglutamate synthase-like GNAT family acetyltransferase